MTPERWQRLKPLFAEAVLLDAGRREAFVEEACGDDPQLGQELRDLLAAEQEATGPLGVDTDISGAVRAVLSPFRPGELILNRFRIVRLVDTGGMGEVYEADDLLLGKVALKTVRPDLASSPDALRRLRQEVQLARKVSRPQVCRIHEFFSLPDDGRHGAAAFISMEFLEGTTLSRRLRSGPLPPREALRVALEIGEGLRLIHAQGIIHRDLKASNIMLCGDRTVLLDFGLAHALAGGHSAAEGSGAAVSNSFEGGGGISGTPAYMAPEQFGGEPISPATDIYAFGVVLYEMVTGVQPYSARTPYGAAVGRAKHPSPPSALQHAVPRHWDRVIDRCLQFEPSERYQSAEDVCGALAASPYRLSSLWNDRRRLVHGAAALLLCALGWLGVLLWKSSQIYTPPAEARRFYDEGVKALDEATYIKSTRLLNQAVEIDPHFAMAHVRLAQAWNELDFQISAQQELLLAMPGESRLAPLDRMYLDAVRSEITGDFAAVSRIDRQIIDRLPAAEQSPVYLSLGFAQERGGEPMEALAAYDRASSLDPHNGAALLHTAVLESRLHKKAEAQKAFDRAEAIYRTEVNQEGLANLHYERGYAANVLGDSALAKQFLEQSLQEAQEIPSVQLQIRTLQQLSSATARYDAGRAAAYAEEAIRLARANRLDSWAAIGLVRLAGAEVRQGKLQQARQTTNEGLQLATQTQQLRVEALANSQLANLENQEMHPDRVIAPATAALAYYQRNGFIASAASVSLLIARAQRDQGQFDAALNAAERSLALASKAGERELMRSSEELLGTVKLAMEDYPDALTHFQRASEVADAESSRQYEAVFSARALSSLGRVSELDAALKFVPASSMLAADASRERIRSLLYQRRYAEALRGIKAEAPDTSAGNNEIRPELLGMRAIAEAHLHRNPEAERDVQTLVESAQANDDRAVAALAAAEVYLTTGRADKAEADARQAADYFHANHQCDSELRSLAVGELAASRLKDLAGSAGFKARLAETLGTIRRTWPPQQVETYLSRPDLKELLTHRT